MAGSDITAAQWHQDHILELPDDAVLLLTNEACRVQGFRLGDTAYGGRGRIEGTVKEKGTPDVPVARQVWLVAEVTGTVIRETWSAPNGTYAFDYIDHRYKYTVVAFDHTGNYRAVIADNLAPVIP